MDHPGEDGDCEELCLEPSSLPLSRDEVLSELQIPTKTTPPLQGFGDDCEEIRIRNQEA